MDITFDVDKSAIANGGKAIVNITSSEYMTAIECRATLSGAPWGRGIGTDVLADDARTVDGVYTFSVSRNTFSFDVESAELLSGDGTYRITVYTRNAKGVWDDTVLFVPSGSSGLLTADGKTFKVQKG